MRNGFENFELWVAPIIVLAFVTLLAVMYGWVGTIRSVRVEERELVEPPQTRLVAKNIPYSPQEGQPVHVETFPLGMGNNTIKLLGGTPVYTGTVGQGVQPVGRETLPLGIGSGSLMLTNKAPIYSGIGGKSGLMQIANRRQFNTPYLGMYLFEAEPAEAMALGLPHPTGIYVKDVISSSPADKAGFMPNDYIIKCDLRSITSLEQINRILSAKEPGDAVKFVIERKGRKKSLHAKLAKLPTSLRAAAAQKTVWMGADIQNIDEVMRVQLKLPDRKGVIISQVAHNSPASAAGLKSGDVIRRFGKVRVRDAQQFQSLIIKKRVGEGVSLVIFRNGQNSRLNMTLGQPPLVASAPPTPVAPAEMTIEGTWIGMDVSELNPNDATNFGLPAGTRGVLVEDVESPPATTIGFQTGDIITAINGTPTLTMKEFVRASRNQSGAVVDVIRGKKHIFITIPPPGYTQQGTRIQTGPANNFRQVAMTTPQPGTVAIFTSNPSLNGSVSGEGLNMPYLILINSGQNSFTVLDRPSVLQLSEIFRQNQVTSLICNYASPTTINLLSSMGVAVYSGVVGPANEALQLYQSGNLKAVR